jgi:hypothetical protein
MTTAGSAVASSASTAAPAGDAKKLRGGERAWPAHTRHAGAARCARQALSCMHLSVYMCIYIFPGASKNTYLYNPYRRQAAARSAQVGKRRAGLARTCARGRPCGRAPCSPSAEGGAAHTKAVRTTSGFHASIDAGWPFECAAAGCRCVARRMLRCMACASVSCAATQTHARAHARAHAYMPAYIRIRTHTCMQVAHTRTRIRGASLPHARAAAEWPALDHYTARRTRVVARVPHEPRERLGERELGSRPPTQRAVNRRTNDAAARLPWARAGGRRSGRAESGCRCGGGKSRVPVQMWAALTPVLEQL